RDRRAGRAIARVLGARQARVRSGSGLQRFLSPRADPERRARGCAPVAGCRRRLRAAAADACARSHGHRRAHADVAVPRIVITPCRKPADYVESVRLAGGDPVVLDLTAAVATEQLANADGLLLTGGGDVDPIHYNEPRHETFSAADPGRDDAELSLAREAMARRLPILAICRGVQVLNVAAGGSLVQDIPSA